MPTRDVAAGQDQLHLLGVGHHGALDVLVGRAVRGVEPLEGGDGLSGAGVRGEDDVGGGEDDVADLDLLVRGAPGLHTRTWRRLSDLSWPSMRPVMFTPREQSTETSKTSNWPSTPLNLPKNPRPRQFSSASSSTAAEVPPRRPLRRRLPRRRRRRRRRGRWTPREGGNRRRPPRPPRPRPRRRRLLDGGGDQGGLLLSRRLPFSPCRVGPPQPPAPPRRHPRPPTPPRGR